VSEVGLSEVGLSVNEKENQWEDGTENKYFTMPGLAGDIMNTVEVSGAF
jgi:hypothetical protein